MENDLEELRDRVATLERELKKTQSELISVSGEALFFDALLEEIVRQGIALGSLRRLALLDFIEASIRVLRRDDLPGQPHPASIEMLIDRLQSLRELCEETVAALRRDGAPPQDH